MIHPICWTLVINYICFNFASTCSVTKLKKMNKRGVHDVKKVNKNAELSAGEREIASLRWFCCATFCTYSRRLHKLIAVYINTFLNGFWGNVVIKHRFLFSLPVSNQSLFMLIIDNGSYLLIARVYIIKQNLSDSENRLTDAFSRLNVYPVSVYC